ncbi:MAG: hydrogenase maturation nickel metallochaperone HypA [Candidatus Marinimicrobia bacterium]|nr:hydrogenase maturation nickel metallochaperone HypA [Candidatus Neomarinimicrobiota bacterium]
MHEMSIAMNIINIACKEAEKDGASSISKIELDVGKLSGVMIDSLNFCYDAVCKGTMAENSTLSINEIPALARCKNCQHSFEIDAFMALCPMCESYEIDILQGRELKLKAVSVNE